jgi:outer membrane protein TolC
MHGRFAPRRRTGGTGTAILVLMLLGAAASPSFAQTTLTLQDAMTRARTSTPTSRALDSAVGEADERIRQARSGYFPRVDVSETVQRGDQPVFVFSSLLSQRRFTAADFAIASLNHPDPITNTRTAVTVDQPVFNAGLTRLSVEAATIGRDLASAERARAGQDLALRAAEAFVRVLQLEAAVRASEAAVAAAESDLERSRARRDTGLVTDADVLAVEVHLADMRQRRLGQAGDLAVARLELADAVGAPLGDTLTLVSPPLPSKMPEVDAVVVDAVKQRWEHRQAELNQQRADNAHRTARAQYLPTVGVQAGWEFNGDTFDDQQSSWIVGAHVQLNLFRGFGDSARLAEAKHAQARAGAERERIARQIEVDVRAASARLAAALARRDVGRAALAQARESQRIIRDRYETGLATATDVLRAAEASLDAESRATAADMDVILQSVALDRALGRL